LFLCAAEAVWLMAIALFYLQHTLPDQYLAERWKVVWIGLDLGIAALALTTLVLILKGSFSAVITSASIGALLLADAWFDCMTAGSTDLTQSLFHLPARFQEPRFSSKLREQ